MLIDSLCQVNDKTDWVAYLTDLDRDDAQSERDFFERCFSSLSIEKRKGVVKDVERGNSSQVESKLYELLIHNLFYVFHLDYEFQPVFRHKGKRLTPDLTFIKDRQCFVCDVFSIQSPEKSVLFDGDGDGRSFDEGNRARNVTDRIEVKSKKYAYLPYPLVLCVFLRDKYSFGMRNVEESILGFTLREIQRMNNYPSEYLRGERREGVFLPAANGVCGNPNLSAVVYCDWYWTRQEPHERRLFCYVMHHWNPKVPLPLDMFENFVQLTWKEHNGNYSPVFSKPSNVVAKFLTNGGIEYSHDNPPKVRVQWG